MAVYTPIVITAANMHWAITANLDMANEVLKGKVHIHRTEPVATINAKGFRIQNTAGYGGNKDEACNLDTMQKVLAGTIT